MLGEDEKYSNASSLKQENITNDHEPENRYVHMHIMSHIGIVLTRVISWHAHKTSDIEEAVVTCEYLSRANTNKKN